MRCDVKSTQIILVPGSICGDDGALKPKKKNGRDENETAWRIFYCDNLFFLVERILAFRYLYIHTHISACFVAVLEIPFESQSLSALLSIWSKVSTMHALQFAIRRHIGSVPSLFGE